MQIPSLKPALPTAAPTAPPLRRGWRKRTLQALLLGLSLAVIVEAARVLFGGNVHEVVPGRVYRTAQLSPDKLRRLVEKRGIRTIINLRGCCNPFDWYLDECRVTHDLNIAQEDITLSANRLPPPSELRELIDVLDHAEYPIVLHCRQGADRTGLASAIAMLLHTNADYATARRQCSPRYAHFEVLSTANMDLFFDMYEAWLKRTGQSHTPERFRTWALNDYRADPAPADLEIVGPVPQQSPGMPINLLVRARNRSNAVWEFKTGTCTGIHIRTVVQDTEGKTIGLYRAGRFEARVGPGESIDIPVLPPFHRTGAYRVTIDLVDRNLNFCQLGSEWLEVEIQVR